MATKDSLHKQALEYHTFPIRGKICTYLPKSLHTKEDLSLAYSPGVASPCLEIAKDQEKVYEYTNKGNMVAVITNGTAVLGLGDIGVMAAKPVMEGKAALLKKFANIDSFDVAVDTRDVDEFVSTVKNIAPNFGAINLEDIKAPECFMIEDRLQEMLDIPIFHDDQHGTAITLCAAFLNALEIQGKDINTVKIVINGAGAGAIASANLLTDLGVKKDQIFMLDSKGLITHDRQDLNQWKQQFRQTGNGKKVLSDVIRGADVFIGLSVAGVLSKQMVKDMQKNPIIFAVANPIPEILPEVVHEVRSDAICATGRSDYPNQVNNLVVFPHIFRGLLDSRAKNVTKEMKINVTKTVASVAKKEVLEEVKLMHGRQDMMYGREYILPSPFDPRLAIDIPDAVQIIQV